MKNKSYKDLTPTQQKEIKQKYLEYLPVAQIAEQYDLPRSSLDYHAKTHWSEERQLLKNELYATFSSNKRVKFIELSTSALQVITRSLDYLAKREVPPTVREAVDAMKILDNLDKIQRLDDGDPTTISAEKPLSIKEIKAQLKSADPFNKEEIEVVEYTEKDD